MHKLFYCITVLFVSVGAFPFSLHAQDAQGIRLASQICKTLEREDSYSTRIERRVQRYAGRIDSAQDTLDNSDNERVQRRAERIIKRSQRRIKNTNRLVRVKARNAHRRITRYKSSLETLDISSTAQNEIDNILSCLTESPSSSPQTSPTQEPTAVATSTQGPLPTATLVPTLLPTPIPTQVSVPPTPVPATPTAPSEPATEIPDIALVDIFAPLVFDEPIDLQSPADGSERIFVAEKQGIISLIVDQNRKETFLDLRSKVVNDGEQGLLGFAFHPEFQTNGIFFVSYSAATDGASTIDRYKVVAGVPEFSRTVLRVPQPFKNHNGGQIAFGPDGYLYIALGDGGSAGDPQGNGQDRSTLLGSLLRIDIDRNPYAVPSSNPFFNEGAGARPEIYAYGLRNPWRFSFDPLDGTLWLGDVGQSSLEEINIIAPGGNYGWNIFEGESCYESTSCSLPEQIPPVFQYGRSEGISVTGGYVYRGAEYPQMEGIYFFADFGFGTLWGLRESNNEVTEIRKVADTGHLVASFGTDSKESLYLLDFRGGKIYKLTPAE